MGQQYLLDFFESKYKEDPERFFPAKEIAEELKVSVNSVRTISNKLISQGFVEVNQRFKKEKRTWIGGYRLKPKDEAIV